MAMKYCTNCGAAMPLESKFCTECGTPFPKADKEETQPGQKPQDAVQPQQSQQQQPSEPWNAGQNQNPAPQWDDDQTMNVVQQPSNPWSAGQNRDPGQENTWGDNQAQTPARPQQHQQAQQPSNPWSAGQNQSSGQENPWGGNPAQTPANPQQPSNPWNAGQDRDPGSQWDDDRTVNAAADRKFSFSPTQGQSSPNGGEWQQTPASYQGPSGVIPGMITEEHLKETPLEPVSSLGWFGVTFLMSIPVVNVIVALIWACGGCWKKAKISFARGWLLKFLLNLIIAALVVLLAVKAGTALLIKYADEHSIAYGAGTELDDILSYFMKYGLKITFSGS